MKKYFIIFEKDSRGRIYIKDAIRMRRLSDVEKKDVGDPICIVEGRSTADAKERARDTRNHHWMQKPDAKW